MSHSDITLAMAKLRMPLVVIGVVALSYLALTSFLFDEATDGLTDLQVGPFYIYFLVPALVLGVFGLVIASKISRTHEWTLLVLVGAVLTFGLSYFLGFLNWDPNASSVPLTRLFSAQILLSNVSTLLLAIHFELLEFESLDSRYLGFIFLLLSPLMAVELFGVMSGEVLPTTAGLNLRSFLTLLTQVGTLVVIYRILSQASRVFNKSNKQAVTLQLVGVYLLMIHVLFEVLDEFISVYNTPWLVGAMLLLGIAYLLDPYSIVLEPTNVLIYGILDRQGLPVHIKGVSQEFLEDEGDRGILVSTLLNAFIAVSKEVAHAQTLESLRFGDRTLIVEYQEPFFIICLASHANYFLDRTIDRYLKQVVAGLEQEHPQVLARARLSQPVQSTPETRSFFQSLDLSVFPYTQK